MFQFQVWFLPFLILATTTALAIPFSRYLAWIMEGRYRAPRFLRWIEHFFNTGPQNWKQYAVSMLLFNTLMFIFGFAVLSLQPAMPLNPDGKGMLAPTTIFNTVCSFLTNTNLQHYAGEQHLSYFSQLFMICWNMFLSASVGFCCLLAIIRALRSDPHMGNYYLDMWRVVIYTFIPASLIMGVLLMADGMPMTLDGAAQVTTVEPGAMGQDENGQPQLQQQIARGPVAALIPIKHLGTNGGGFFGANSAHPFENPSAWSNFLSMMNYCIFPFALVLMFGRMLHQMRHAWIIFGVMMLMFVAMIGWGIYWDTLQPNPGSGRAARGSKPGEPGGQGTAIRHLGRSDFRRRDHGYHLRIGKLHARQPEPAGRTYSLDRHVAKLRVWRQGRGNDKPAAVPDRGCFHCRIDGGAHAGIPGQKSRSPGNETRHDSAVGPSDNDLDADRAICGYGLGHQGDEQSGRPWILGSTL